MNAHCDIGVLNFGAVNTPPNGTVSPLAKTIGRFQLLKAVYSGAQYLCEYLDILKNSKGEVYVVSEHQKQSLQEYAREQLSNYGLFFMTGNGADVHFPIGYPKYLAPEVVADETQSSLKTDTWSLGMLILELCYGEHKLFPETSTVDDILEKILSWNEDTADAQPLADIDIDQSDTLFDFLTTCLTVDPNCRPSPASLLNHPFVRDVAPAYPSRWKPKPLLISSLLDSTSNEPTSPHNLTLSQLFYLWRLNGGDIGTELLKRGVASSPPIERIPYLVQVTEDLDQLLSTSDALHPYSDEEIVISLEEIREKLITSWTADVQEQSASTGVGDWKSVLPWTAQTLEKDVAAIDNGTPKLSLSSKEKNAIYQAQRIKRFTKLLYEYPASRDEILREAAVDIPPLWRGRIWAAILEVKGDPDLLYESIDKETETANDRQLDLDIPRCHQYNELLSSHIGHKKLKRVLKAWLTAEEDKLVYWQGLDSVCAPFITLNFNNESLAFSSMRAFLKKYSASFFVADNSVIMQEYMVAFRHILAFHDPELAVHMEEIGLGPELFALPWFMTLYAHIFPLDKIYHLWDAFLTGPPFLHLHTGCAILQQLRDQLIHRDFNTVSYSI
ncbi:hypothetical protein HDV00_000095 [Rhizophlyctis rosea]|nr:hypothetical protein HDV00_000095 [Rhizophlyctis rosea]